MSALVDEVGKTYGKLRVLGRAEAYRYTTRDGYDSTQARWRCVCECGRETDVIGYMLRRGLTRSCGCLRANGGRATGFVNKPHPLLRKIMRYRERGLSWSEINKLLDFAPQGAEQILRRSRLRGHV